MRLLEHAELDDASHISNRRQPGTLQRTKPNIGGTAAENEPREQAMRSFTHLLRTAIVLMGFTALQVHAQDGETLFKQNCSACHKLGKRLVGPDLTGVTEKRSKEWLHEFIKSSQTMIKRGDPDAVAVFKENNELIMTDIALPVGDIDLILEYIASQSKPVAAADSGAAVAAEADAPIVYTDADRLGGRDLFSGQAVFSAGGAACISCHNVTHASLMVGGGLAKDLTGAFGRMGHAGIAGILNAPPFPAMASTYGNAPLTEAEIHQLAAFLEQANLESDKAPVQLAAVPYAVFGGGGLLVILALIGLHWRSRLKGSVKQDILDRQIRSI